MSDQRRLRVRTLFAHAADLAPHERGAFLDGACRDDPALRAEVDALLAYDSGFTVAQDETGFLKSPLVREPVESPPDDFSRPARADLGRPTQIGRYRILRWHGEGGMGAVYEAEQDNPRRSVALKVIRTEMLSPELVKRFRNEAQILARLQHSGIAQVYEAGMSEDGRPFFAMEFIRGMPLDKYVRSHGLETKACLELLAKVCDAVQHAHDKGVIHRDLKPGNILVDESGHPKVLDFGVAHVTAADMLSTASDTRTGQLLGTLSYMSPEQLTSHAAALDGRSDVYTLGVILFELLAHRLPYHLEHLPLPEVARVIQHQEPSRLGSIDTLYRGDIEIIVAKALEKDKTRRFASAGELASDIRRYLRGEAILARAPSALYQLRKLARRHKALVAGAIGIFAALLVGTAVAIAFALRAAESARAARGYARIASERERIATRESYRARIAAATAAFSNHDVVDAAHQLDAAPRSLRDWEWRHLRTRLDDSTSVFRSAGGECQYLIRDPNGIRIAQLTPTRVRVIDLDGHPTLERAFGRELGLIGYRPQFTRNGLRLVVLGRKTRDWTLELLDEEGRLQTLLSAPEGMEPRMAIASPDGSRVAALWSGPSKWAFTLHDADSGAQLAGSSQDIGYTWAMAFSPDGKHIATAAEDGRARLWDTTTGALTAECRGHRRKVLSVAFRPDGRRLVTASSDGTVRQWDCATGKEVESPYDRHTGEVVTAAYSTDGRSIASGGTDRTVRVWDAASRVEVAVLHGHTGAPSDLAFSSDDRRLVSTSELGRLNYTEDRSARIWDIGKDAGRSVLLGHESYVYPVAYSSDGRWIASGGWDNKVRVWDALTGENCAALPHRTNVRALAFSPDGSWLVSGCGGDGSLFVWNAATGRLEHELKGPATTAVQTVVVSPDGTRIAAANAEGSAWITDRATGSVVGAFALAMVIEKKSLAYSPDGRLLASTGEDSKQIDIWDTQTLRRTARLSGHTNIVYSVAFSKDGRWLASASKDRTVRVWDVAARICTTVLTGHTDSVFSAVFHPDGARLASGGRDRAVWLWDLATGEEVARLEGHTNYVFSLAFSPDGTTLASASGDGTIRLWDTEPPARRHQARRDADALRPVAERLVKALFQDKNSDAAEVLAALRADRTLSEAQRKAALREVLRQAAK
jgi:WD40 repeat protein/predicted Ser/Thr protein kinase